ncbi:MAG: hypothetical protein ACOX21_06325 [Bacillota bacterium]|jgi:hypothetical protein
MYRKIISFFLVVLVFLSSGRALASGVVETVIYQEELLDDNGNPVSITVKKQNGDLLVEVCVNNQLAKTAHVVGGKVDPTTEIILTNHESNLTTKHIVKEIPYCIVEESPKAHGNISTMQGGLIAPCAVPSYPLKMTGYSGVWGKWGYLYAEDFYYTRDVFLLIEPGTSLALVVALLVGIALGAVAFTVKEIIYALGGTLIGSVVTSLAKGTVRQDVVKTLGEVFVDGKFVSGIRIEKYTTKLYNRTGGLAKIKHGASYGGPYTTLREALFWGIEYYCLHEPWFR